MDIKPNTPAFVPETLSAAPIKPKSQTRESILAPPDLSNQKDSLILSREATQEKFNEADRVLTKKFFNKLEAKTGVTSDVFFEALSSLSDKELEGPARAVTENLFKKIELPFAKKIQALRQYQNFLDERQSKIKRIGQEDSNALMSLDTPERDVAANINKDVDTMTKNAVDMGLALYRAQHDK